jgi:hypothetical protein
MIDSGGHASFGLPSIASRMPWLPGLLSSEKLPAAKRKTRAAEQLSGPYSAAASTLRKTCAVSPAGRNPG